MNSHIRNASFVFAVLCLTGCASTPDPAVVCTAEWIEPRAERAVKRIETRAGKALDALKDAGNSWLSGDSPGPLQLYRLSNAVDDLENELRNGRGIRDLRTLASTCDDPELIRSRFMDLLDRQNIPTSITKFLERTGFLDRLIDMAERGDGSERES